jgi:hypothetical protein
MKVSGLKTFRFLKNRKVARIMLWAYGLMIRRDYGPRNPDAKEAVEVDLSQIRSLKRLKSFKSYII